LALSLMNWLRRAPDAIGAGVLTVSVDA
jgi:hypothetical protein